MNCWGHCAEKNVLLVLERLDFPLLLLSQLVIWLCQ